MTIDNDKFNDLIKPITGMTISRPWRGIGSAIFLEIGQIRTQVFRGREQKHGEANICIEWDWRIESDIEVICGSSNSAPEIESHLGTLLGLSINGITIHGRPSELIVSLSNGMRLRSMAMVSGDPQWTIRLKDASWLSSEHGVLVVSDGTEEQGLTDDERAVSDRATETAKRWGKPSVEPVLGQCRDCSHFVMLDGDFALLDYGACKSPTSPYDRRVTHLNSGCPAFISAF